MNLIIVRHGETHLNKEHRILGLNDVPLNSTGRAQAGAAGHALKADMPFVMYCSPVARALETANIISEAVLVSPTPVDELREADAGDLDGITSVEMRARYPEFMKRWAEDPSTARMPGGETLQQVQERTWSAIAGLFEKHPDEAVVMVGHNFTNLTIIAKVLDIPLRNFRRLRQNLGAITRVEISRDSHVLVSLNETAHLRGIT